MSNSEYKALDEFEELARKNNQLEVDRNGSVVFVKGDFNELPSAGEAPESISVNATRVDGRIDVRPIDVGGERMDISPQAAIDYIENTFL